jgi:hypothetical protein
MLAMFISVHHELNGIEIIPAVEFLADLWQNKIIV